MITGLLSLKALAWVRDCSLDPNANLCASKFAVQMKIQTQYAPCGAAGFKPLKSQQAGPRKKDRLEAFRSRFVPARRHDTGRYDSGLIHRLRPG
jgi:hypothetical protein